MRDYKELVTRGTRSPSAKHVIFTLTRIIETLFVITQTYVGRNG